MIVALDAVSEPVGVRLPNVDSAITLPDGRRLGVAEYGDPEGSVVLWFHGLPGARHQVPPVVQSRAAFHGLRVVSIERPGIGLSTNHLYHRVRDFAVDVEFILDRLRINEFGVVGLSAGGAYALAVAHALPERTVSLSLLCSVAPGVGDHRAPHSRINELNRRYRAPLTLVRRPAGRVLWLAVRAMRPFVDPLADAVLARMPESDAAVLRDPASRKVFIGDFMRNSRHQLHVVLNDSVLFGRHWGFDIREIQVPAGVWVGTDDTIVRPEHGYHLAATIPGAELYEHVGGGHLVGFAAADEVLTFISDQLAARRSPEKARSPA